MSMISQTSGDFEFLTADFEAELLSTQEDDFAPYTLTTRSGDAVRSGDTVEGPVKSEDPATRRTFVAGELSVEAVYY